MGFDSHAEVFTAPRRRREAVLGEEKVRVVGAAVLYVREHALVREGHVS